MPRVLGENPDRDTFTDAVNRPVSLFAGGGMRFFQHTIDDALTLSCC